MTLGLGRQAGFSGGRFFGIGLTVGLILGFVSGSILALCVGNETLQAVRGLVGRVSGRDERVNFELLLQ